MSATQGLLPPECSRFDVCDAYAAFVDFWNSGGLTERCKAKGRGISCALSRLRYLHRGEYLQTDGAREIYLGLIERYHPEHLDAERAEIAAMTREEWGMDTPQEDAMNEHKYQLRLICKDGSTVESGAETRELAIEHARQCLRNGQGGEANPVVEAWYTGRNGKSIPLRVTP